MGRMKGLGIAPVIVPSVDPVSIAINTIAGVSVLIAGLRQIGAGRREADEVVQVQNILGESLEPISLAAQDPDVTLGELVTLRDRLDQLGREFYDYTLDFERAGPGARRTIFGELINGIWTPVDPDAPGWLTRLLRYIQGRIDEKTSEETAPVDPSVPWVPPSIEGPVPEIPPFPAAPAREAGLGIGLILLLALSEWG